MEENEKFNNAVENNLLIKIDSLFFCAQKLMKIGSKSKLNSHFFIFFRIELGPGGIVYDSDSSLTLAAAKSLSLSNSLSKQCGLELDQQQLALDDEKKGRRHSSSNDSTSSVRSKSNFAVSQLVVVFGYYVLDLFKCK